MKNAGLSMIELTVATAISAFTFLVLTQSNDTLSRSMKLYTDVQRLVSDLTPLRAELGRYFSRAVNMSRIADGTVRAGMEIDGNGMVLLASDLRPCSELDPSTSLDPANITEIRIMCCSPNLSLTLDLPSPPYAGGTSQTFQSACVDQSGLSLQLSKNGTVTRSVCYPEFDEFYMYQAGLNRVRNRPLFQFQFVANFSKANSTEVLKTQRFEFFDSIGGMDSLTIHCQ